MLRTNQADTLQRAEQMSAEGRLDEAAALYASALADQPDSVETMFGLAIVDMQRGYYAVAMDLLARTRAEMSKTAAEPALLALVESRLGLAAYQLCDASLALEHWENSLRLAHDDEVVAWIAETRPMAESLVSIVIPTYNYAHFLGETLQSIFAQTYKNLQVIVVNDASTDNTDELIADLQQRCRFEYIKNERNLERSASLNIGSRSIRGQYVIAFDADDIMLPEAVASHIDNLVQHPDALMSYGRYELLFPDGSLRAEDTPQISGEMFDFILSGNFILPSATMYRNDAWLKTEGFNEATTFQDSDLWLKLLYQGGAEPLNRVVAHYRRHPENASSPKHAKTQYVSRMTVLNHWRDQPTYDFAWMQRWNYHDQTLPDDVVEALIAEGYHDPYLDYRCARLHQARGDSAKALEFAQRAKDSVTVDSYVAPALYSTYLQALKDSGATDEAVAFCKRMFAQKGKFKTADFCWAAGEFLVDRCRYHVASAKDWAVIEAWYEQCLAIGEPTALYVLTKGSGTCLPAMQLGQLNAMAKRHDKALHYFNKARDYGMQQAYGAFTRARRKTGKMPQNA